MSSPKRRQTNQGSERTSGRKWRYRRRRYMTTTYDDDDDDGDDKDDDDDEDDDDNDGDDDDDDEKRLARHAHVVGASAAATTAELRGCLPRRTAPGGLQRLRHPTSPAILHRACASKAAYTPPPTPSLSFSPSSSVSLISSRTVASLANPRFAPLASHPLRYLSARAQFEGYTLRFVESAFCDSLLTSSAKKRGSIPQSFSSFRPLYHFSFFFVFLSHAVCLRTLAFLVLTHFLFIPLRDFVSVIFIKERGTN